MDRTEKENAFLQALGTRVRTLRRERGWSQEDLAFRCDLHRTYVGSVERGERNVSALNIRRIADALGVPASHLLEDLK